MLFLLFQLEGDRYALEASRVVEVLPLLHVKAMPRAPRGIAGLIHYRGVAVPVVDLGAWTLRRPAEPRMSTRLVIVQTDATVSGLLALIAERATESVRLERAQFAPSGVAVAEARYLGPVATDAGGRLVQWIELEKLLPGDVRDALREQPVSSA